MKRKLLPLLFSLFSLMTATKAQYVNVADVNFRNFLRTKFPSCFNANQQLDTVCALSISTIDLSSGYPNTYLINNVDEVKYFKNLDNLKINGTGIAKISSLPKRIRTLDLSFNFLDSLPTLPDTLQSMLVNGNNLSDLPALPQNLEYLDCSQNNLSFLYISANLTYLTCSFNPGLSFLAVPQTLTGLDCSNTSVQTLFLPDYLSFLDCSNTPINLNNTSLPLFLQTLVCSNIGMSTLPPLPFGLGTLVCNNNPLTSLPSLPSGLNQLEIAGTNIRCLPVLPQSMQRLIIDTNNIPCIPNSASGLLVNNNNNYPICRPTNNVNGCASFPVMQGYVFYDLNSNGIKDAGEYIKKYGKVGLSSGAFTFTDTAGNYQLGSDTIGSFTVTPTAPKFFNVVPVSNNYNFSTYDTSVTGNYALQPAVNRDSVKVLLIPIQWRARPGFGFSYKIGYMNAGSTNLSATSITLHYDASLMTFANASDPAVTNTGNMLTLNLPSLPVGEFGEFTANFNLKSTAPLGNTIVTDISMTSGAQTSTDTARTLITGSYDPNDKDATPTLTPDQVIDGKYIDYTLRFQNTGTDTAIHVVITDTLSNLLQVNSLELVSTSHPCQAIIQDRAVSFVMRNIMLPDVNVNEAASHGFISFRIKPVSTVTLGTTISNKAAIYFDYNSPVITNTAVTTIASQVVPLKLISFTGRRMADNSISLHWITNNEINSSGFIIEQSTNGHEFASITNVKARGYGNNNYSYAITNAGKGNLYFRLKMIDKDGSYAYSPVVLIRDEAMNVAFVLQQNPVRNNITMMSITDALLSTEAVLINTNGTIVKRFIIRSANQTVSTNDLSSGTYYLKTLLGNETIIISK